jgi:hypothetical protein
VEIVAMAEVELLQQGVKTMVIVALVAAINLMFLTG